ncbi:hypothetical protein CROQUDRAFT_73296 [Cronartium quercuum f. sp. fusiforme G11]|uniref:Uncharacterized protein n=1 Tax=Cronartium quercuum f. sp. fusiforme G11 TaxID=708437 RepID=A0A9P6NRB1_9BASI|nr:hypothetical protein CROQUDRAFT_73296 [Cronartium quercuum f. sp. fusiforme G11]
MSSSFRFHLSPPIENNHHSRIQSQPQPSPILGLIPIPPLIPSPSPSSSTFSFRRTSINFANRLRARSPTRTNTSHENPSPSSNKTVFRAKCPCCSCPIVYAQTSTQIQCSTCQTHWPLYPAPSSSSTTTFSITSDHVRTLRSLALSPEQLKAFDADPAGYIRSSPDRDNIECFYTFAAELVTSLFASTICLSSAFAYSRSTHGSNSEPVGLRLRLARAFFMALVSGPGGRELLIAKFSSFLSQPGHELWSIGHHWSRHVSNIKTSDWAWAPVLFECAGVLANSGMAITDRFSKSSRLLGLSVTPLFQIFFWF